MLIYTVKAGDTVQKISASYNVPPFVINALNEPPTDYLVPGQRLVLRRPSALYTVKIGESISTIAEAAGIEANTLLRNNPQAINRVLYPGETLVLGYEDDNEKGRSLLINAYTYPYTNKSLIVKALPYLSMLTIFTYGFTPSGELIAPDDEEVIALAASYGVKPVMLISTLTAEGTFSNELADFLLSSPYLQDILIERILENMLSKGYYALDIDFEYVPARNKEAYIAFVENITNRLNQNGLFTIVALAPKTSSTQPGLLYESHDYFALGMAANLAFTMTYEWGYTYGPPMAVAPINKVREVLEYAVTEISPQKLLMGIPLYGYDWNIPFVRGTAATSLSPQQAIVIAYENGVPISYDKSAQAPFFRYGNDTHEVWFEDAQSIYAKLRLLDSFSLAGAGYWNLARDFPQNWSVLNALFGITRL